MKNYLMWLSVTSLILLSSFAEAGTPCGITSTPECDQIKTTKSGNTWRLIVRTKLNSEVWKDEETGAIWSDRLTDVYRFWSTVEVNGVGGVVKELICTEEASLEKRGYLSKITWRMPKLRDFVAAESNGIREVLPNLKGHWFWSSTVAQTGMRGRGSNGFNGSTGDLDYIEEWLKPSSVVCLSKE
jgi:hypothetical protein